MTKSTSGVVRIYGLKTLSDWWLNEQDMGETDCDDLTRTKRSMDLQESSLAFLDFFKIATQIFQTRNLTVDGDAVNTMAGLLARVRQHVNSEIVQGNIAAILPLLLLFLHRALLGEEKKLEGVPLQRPNSISDTDELESDNILLKIAPDYTPEEYEHCPERPVPVKNYTILVFCTFMIRLRLVPSR